MLSPDQIQQMGNLPIAKKEKLILAPGNDVQGSSWKNLKNLRLRVRGNNVFWQTRGGSTLVNNFAANILTTEAVDTSVQGVLKQYIVVHTADGKVYLWDLSLGSSTEIASSGFSTTQKIQIYTIGQFVYLHDYDNGKEAYYDLVRSTLYDYLSYNKAYIHTQSWLAEDLSEDTTNIWGYQQGERILVFPNNEFSASTEIYTSDGISDGTKDSFNPATYNENSFYYNYNSGKYLEDNAGKQYKSSQFITFRPGSEQFGFTVKGTGTDFTIDRFYIPLDENGGPSFVSYIAKVDSVSNNIVSWKDPAGVDQAAALGNTTAGEENETNLPLPYNDDLEELVGLPCKFKLSSDGVSIQANSKYKKPEIYRQYAVFELLRDGSVTQLGLPYQLKATATEILVNGYTQVSFTATTPDTAVNNRFLVATRWQLSKRRAFDPSNDSYSNSPLFFVGPFKESATIIRDATPDRRLIRPITEFQPMIAGVSDLFGSGQLSTKSVAKFRNSVMHAGYTVNRPIPDPYTDASAETDGNIYINITATEQLANNMALAFLFLYSDGTFSNVVQTEKFLQLETSSTSSTVDCGQTKASASHSLTNGVDYDGDIIVTYDGYELTISLTVASHASAADAAEAIRAAIQADTEIQISASITSTPQIDYSEERFGEEFNGNSITYTDVIPYDVGGASYVQSFDVAASAPNAVTFNNDGTKMYTIRASNNRLNEYNLSTAWDISTAVSSGNFLALGAEDTSPQGVCWNDDGTKLFVVGQQNNNIYEYSIGTAFDLSGTNSFTTSYSIATETTTAEGLTVNSDGTKFYVIDGSNLYMYECSTGFNLTTMGYTAGDTFSISTQTTGGDGVAIKSDGTKLVITDNTTLYEYDFGTNYEVNTLTYSGTSFDHSATTTDASNLFTGNNGTKLYLSDESTGLVYEYDLPSGIGVTFDTEPITMAGGDDPDGIAAKAYIWLGDNSLSTGIRQVYVLIDGDGAIEFTVSPGDSITQVHLAMVDAINDALSELEPNWTATMDIVDVLDGPRPVVVVTADDVGNTAFNDLTVNVVDGGETLLSFYVSAPGKSEQLDTGETGGAVEACLSAEGYFDVSANGLTGGATEDHTITLDGDSTPAITIAEADTTEDIVDKYIIAIRGDESLDRLWRVSKADQGGGTWRLIAQYREFGTAYNGLVVSIAGNSSITVSVTSPTAGGTDAGSVPTSTIQTIEANKIQIHSLNTLVDKVFVLGRTTGPTFHLIDEFQITDPEAHGEVVVLPGKTDELDTIELSTFDTPNASQILETTGLINYVNVGTPAQQFQIFTQEEIESEYEIIKAVPLAFDVDKATMRFQVLLFTTDDIELGYLVDSVSRSGRVFEGDFEIVGEGLYAISAPQGIRRRRGVVYFETNDGVYQFDGKSLPSLLFDKRRYSVSEDNTLQDIVLNMEHNELWFLYGASQIVVYDFDSQSTRIMEYAGALGTISAGAFYLGNLYVGAGTGLLFTDQESVYTDNAQALTAEAETDYIGDELTQMRILDVTIGGQQFSCSVAMDYQDERFIDVGTGWQDAFEEDQVISAKTLNMAGQVFSFYRYAIMPRLKLAFNAVAGGFLSHVILKYVPTRNDGQSRE